MWKAIKKMTAGKLDAIACSIDYFHPKSPPPLRRRKSTKEMPFILNHPLTVVIRKTEIRTTGLVKEHSPNILHQQKNIC